MKATINENQHSKLIGGLYKPHPRTNKKQNKPTGKKHTQKTAKKRQTKKKTAKKNNKNNDKNKMLLHLTGLTLLLKVWDLAAGKLRLCAGGAAGGPCRFGVVFLGFPGRLSSAFG